MQIKEIERGSYPKPKVAYIPTPCQHCEAAPCMDPHRKRRRLPPGRTASSSSIPEKAKGQKAIVNACPYRVIFWNEELQLPQKCTLCAHMLDEGEKLPRCVESCPTTALVFGDLDDPQSDISVALAAAQTEDYHPEFGSQPLVKYVGIPKRFVVGEVVRKDIPGECVEGVLVTIEGDGFKRETRTDIFGDFDFDGLEKDSTFKLRVEYQGYAPKVVEVVTRRDVDLGEVVLEPLS